MEQIRTNASGQRGRTINISYYQYIAIVNRILAIFTKSAAFVMLAYGVRL